MISLNPAISLVSAFIFTLILSFSTFEIFYLIPLVYLIFLRKDEFFQILKKLILLNLFLLVLFLSLLIESTFQEALNIYIRANVIILFNLCLFHGSLAYDIVRALNILKFPSKFVSSTFFTIKMIEFLKKDFKNIFSSLKSRGFKANTSMFTYYTYGNIFALLFVKAIKKSKALNDSFTSRSFKGKIYLSEDFKVSNVDYILIFLLSFIILLKAIL